jgi:glycosidase
MRSLLENPFPDYAGILQLLHEHTYTIRRGQSPCERRFTLVVMHLASLLEHGETVYFDGGTSSDSWLNTALTIQRVALEGGALWKVVAKLSTNACPHDSRSFHEYVDGPSIVIHKNPVTVDTNAGQTGLSILEPSLPMHDALEMYRIKQVVTDKIRAGLVSRGTYLNASTQRHVEEDRSVVRNAFSSCTDRLVKASAICRRTRASHPYRGAQLLILPRLIRIEDGTTVFKYIESQLPAIKTAGFVSIMLAPVDKQSVHTYYDDTIDGRLTPYLNNHGYWSSGETGVDPLLGSGEDYHDLIKGVARYEMSFTQDCTFGTLGYTAQIPRFASSSLHPSTEKLVVGMEALDVWDEHAFLHEKGVSEEDGLGIDVSSEHYASVLSKIHTGSLFNLPRPNLFDPEIRKRVMIRSLWLATEMGVCSFRVDMAKHLGIEPLNRILCDLKKSVEEGRESGRTEAVFSTILEYWTTKYRDLCVASSLLNPKDEAIYFYDFPLANALQKVFMRKEGFYSTMRALQCERERWASDLCQLVPTFIDHDSYFRPIYNGSTHTSSIVVCGYAMCLMMSANAPCVYFGFDNAEAGVNDLDEYFFRTEKDSRKAVKGMFSHDDRSPLKRVSELLRLFERHAILENWDGEAFEIAGEFDRVQIGRVFHDRVTGACMRVTARFSRYEMDKVPDGEHMIFSHLEGPSVTLSLAPLGV